MFVVCTLQGFSEIKKKTSEIYLILIPAPDFEEVYLCKIIFQLNSRDFI
jgi:hypothetical protein